MNPQFNIMLGQAVEAFQAGNFERASSILQKVLQLDAKCLPALHILGLIKAANKEYKDAAEFLGRAVRLNPKEPSIFYNLAKALSDGGRLDESLPHYEKAVALAPKYQEAWMGFGEALVGVKKYQLALDAFDKATLLNPLLAEAWSNKGNVLHILRLYEEALGCFDRAISIDPNLSQAYYNKGVTQSEMRRIEAAVISFSTAISLKENFFSAIWNKSLCDLQLGNLSEGFAGHEARHNRVEIGNSIEKRIFNKPLWLGDASLENKTILLYGEQGLGDFIQFCRYAKSVADLGGRVILEVPKPLYELMLDLDGVSQLVIKGEELPPFDYQCPLLSLPLAFKTTLTTLPKIKKYISLEDKEIKIAEWNIRLGAKTKPRVGLVWSGNPLHKNDRNRSVPLSEIVQYLPSQFQYVSLQKEIREADELTLKANSHIANFGQYLNDFSDTATLIDCLDLVISVDTSVAHLSGALGSKTWVLLPFVPDWRWLLDREDSPWYPSIKLFRQDKLGDWSTALNKISVGLARLMV